MRPPGGVDELDEAGRAQWAERVQRRVGAAVNALGLDAPSRFIVTSPDDRTPHRTLVDWPGLPLRPINCLGRHQALSLLDWTPPGEGRQQSLQDEYLEWRVVSDGARIERVELTTELADYWSLLAALDPATTLKVVGRFAREQQVDPEALYGDCDPFHPSTTPQEREAAFRKTMIDGDNQSPYNDGRAAITCMTQSTNTLGALVQLALAAAYPRVVRDRWSGKLRCLTCDELIPLLSDSAQLGRASDPVLVERLARLAYEGRLVALDNPVGVYIQSAEHTRLRTPSGDIVPPEWFRFDRGTPGSGRGDQPARWQRVTLEVPPKTGLLVSDLIDVTTEEKITFGGQIADLIQAAVVLRVSDPDAVEVGDLEPSELAGAVADAASRCAGIDDALARFQLTRS